MKKYLYGLAVIAVSLLTACDFGAGQQNTDVKPADISVVDIEADPVKQEVTVDTDTEKETSDTRKDETETENTDKENPAGTEVNTPAPEERPGYVNFIQYTEGVLDVLPAEYSKLYDGTEKYSEAIVDLDKDGLDDKILVVELNDSFYIDGIAGDLYVIFDNGNAYSIGTENYYEYYKEVQFYTNNSERNFVTLNFANSVTNTDGYVFSGNEDELVWYTTLPIGEKHIDEFGYLVVTQEDYTGQYDSETGLWSGHTWMPHLFYYDTEKDDFCEYGIKEITLEEVEDCANFDPSNILGDNITIDKMYIRDDYTLIVITVEDAGGLLCYTTHFYWVAQADWVLQESITGIYQ